VIGVAQSDIDPSCPTYADFLPTIGIVSNWDFDVTKKFCRFRGDMTADAAMALLEEAAGPWLDVSLAEWSTEVWEAIAEKLAGSLCILFGASSREAFARWETFWATANPIILDNYYLQAIFDPYVVIAGLSTAIPAHWNATFAAGAPGIPAPPSAGTAFPDRAIGVVGYEPIANVVLAPGGVPNVFELRTLRGASALAAYIHGQFNIPCIVAQTTPGGYVKFP
jgi:hypothetical protein